MFVDMSRYNILFFLKIIKLFSRLLRETPTTIYFCKSKTVKTDTLTIISTGRKHLCKKKHQDKL